MSKARMTLIFPADTSDKPITWQLVKDFDLKVNILKAEITSGKKGHLLIELDGTEIDINRAKKFMEEERIRMLPVKRQILLEADKCIHCGACTGVCFSNALKINPESMNLEFNSEQCIVCGLCIDGCPMGAIKSGFGEEM